MEGPCRLHSYHIITCSRRDSDHGVCLCFLVRRTVYFF
uniref:Uncharacterized protein n=1 Tax=Rhizophora mucronata TaxID=61149 RepID=A0A2P2LRF3_RHIMU